MKEKMEMLKKAIKRAGMENEVIINEELVKSIFGDNLEIPMTEDELVEMFLFEL